jgi:hypothetical protein
MNYSSPNDTSLVVVPLPPSCVSKWDFAHCFNSNCVTQVASPNEP